MATRNPQAWNLLRDKVQRATRKLSDADLLSRTAKQQLRWKRTRSPLTFDILQELYTEQHRRLHAG